MSQAGELGAGGSSPSGLGFVWNTVTAADNIIQIKAQNAYVAKGAGQCVFLLPAAAVLGTTFLICGYGNLWELTQNANQTVIVGFIQTSLGISGSLTATTVSDTIMVSCVTANTEWKVINMIGNPTVT